MSASNHALAELRGFCEGVESLVEYTQETQKIENELSSAHSVASKAMATAFGRMGKGSYGGGWQAHAELNLGHEMDNYLVFTIGSQYEPKPDTFLIHMGVSTGSFEKDSKAWKAWRTMIEIVDRTFSKDMSKVGKIRKGHKTRNGIYSIGVHIPADAVPAAIKQLSRTATRVGKLAGRVAEKGQYTESVMEGMYSLLEDLDNRGSVWYQNPMLESKVPRITKLVDRYETDDYPSGRHRVKAVWEVERKGKKSRVARVTHNPKTGLPAKPKRTTYGLLTKIGIGADGRTYIVQWNEYGFIGMTKGDMKFDAGSLHPSSDPKEWEDMLRRLIKANPGDPQGKVAERYIDHVKSQAEKEK